MKIVIKNRQTFFDIGLQYCGDREAAFAIAMQNDIAITEFVEAGTELEVPQPYNQRIVDYYKNNNIEPATEIATPDTLIRTDSGEIIRSESGEPYTININTL